MNTGLEQDALDALEHANVEVVALTVAQVSPHLELLAYRPPVAGPALPLPPCDIAATRLVFECAGLSGERAVLLHDPDGHAVVLVPVQ